MLTKIEALELVSKELKRMSPPSAAFMVNESCTIERPFGWVFFYNSQKFLETGNFLYQLAGNGPVIVNKHDGTAEFFGSAKGLEKVIQEYEDALNQRGSDS